jgi:hypothetical protein
MHSMHLPVHMPPWQARPPLQAVPLALGGGELHTPVARLHVLWPCLHSLWGGQVTPTHMSVWGLGGYGVVLVFQRTLICLGKRLHDRRHSSGLGCWLRSRCIQPACIVNLYPSLELQPAQTRCAPTFAHSALAGAAPAAGRAVGLGSPRAARTGRGVAHARHAFALQPPTGDADAGACGSSGFPGSIADGDSLYPLTRGHSKWVKLAVLQQTLCALGLSVLGGSQ